MRAKDGFTLAVALAQLLIELFGKRRQTMLQPGIVFRTRRNRTITFRVITLPKRERTCSYAPASTLPYSRSGLRRISERGNGCAASSAGVG